MARWAVSLLLLALARSAVAFPTYVSKNGTSHLTSAFGGDVALEPSGRGRITARALLDAQGGVQLNTTTLTDSLLGNLASVIQAQANTMTAITSAFQAQTNSMTLINLASNVTAQLAVQQGIVQQTNALVANNMTAAFNTILSNNAALQASNAALTAANTNLTAQLSAVQTTIRALTTMPTCNAPYTSTALCSGFYLSFACASTGYTWQNNAWHCMYTCYYTDSGYSCSFTQIG